MVHGPEPSLHCCAEVGFGEEEEEGEGGGLVTVGDARLPSCWGEGRRGDWEGQTRGGEWLWGVGGMVALGGARGGGGRRRSFPFTLLPFLLPLFFAVFCYVHQCLYRCLPSDYIMCPFDRNSKCIRDIDRGSRRLCFSFPRTASNQTQEKKVLKKKFTVTVSEGSRKRPFKIYVAGLLPLASCCGLELADDLE